MTNCDEKINYLMSSNKNAKDFMSKLGKNEEDNIFSLDKFKICAPYVVSEEVFLKLINMAKKHKLYNNLLKEIEGFIITKENITNKVFDELLNMAKNGNDWLFLGLCHARLSKDKQKILKELNLPVAFWY